MQYSVLSIVLIEAVFTNFSQFVYSGISLTFLFGTLFGLISNHSFQFRLKVHII